MENTDPLVALPQAVVYSIVRSLDIKSIVSCELVCKYWHQYISNPAIWKKIPIHATPGLPTKWNTLQRVLQLPKFHLQSHLELRYLYLCNPQADAVVNFVTSGGVLRHLSHLNLEKCNFLTSNHILSITSAPFATHLKSLTLRFCPQLANPEDVLPFAKLTTLTYLDCGESSITPRHLGVLSTLTNLKSLSLWHCSQQKNEQFIDDWENLKYFPKLESFNATRCKFVANKTVACLAQYNTRLTGLNLADTALDANCMPDIIKLTSLTSLNLWCCKEVSDSIGLAAKLPSLTWFNIGGCRLEDSQVIPLLTSNASARTLDSLNLSASSVSDASLDYLPNLPALQTLNLSYCTNLQPLDFRAVAKLPHIRSVTLRKSSITDEGLSHLCNSTSLQVLILGYSNISDPGLKYVGQCTKLESLNIQYCENIGDEGIAHLTSLTNMRMLYLGGCTRITDLSLKHIASGMKYLLSLNLGGCNKITDLGLSYLPAIKYLSMLDLYMASRVTDYGLKDVGKLKHLHSFTLTNNNNITKQGIMENLLDLPLDMLNVSICSKLDNEELQLKPTTKLHKSAAKPPHQPRGANHPSNINKNKNVDHNQNDDGEKKN